MPADTSPSDYAEKPGTFHVSVLHLEDDIQKSAVVVQFQIWEGTDKSQNKRTHRQYFNNPQMSHGDGGAFAASVQVRLAMILGVPAIFNGEETPWDKVPPGADIEIAWVDQDGIARGMGCQLVIKLALKPKSKGSDEMRLQIDGRSMWAVDDPDVADIPKSIPALRLIGKESVAMKKPADPADGVSKANSGKGSNGNGNGHANKAATPPAKRETAAATAASAASAASPALADLDDL